MNTKEKKELQKKLEKANELENLIKNLEEALEKVKSKNCKRLAISLDTSSNMILAWSNNKDFQTGDYFQKVCWAFNFENITKDFENFVIIWLSTQLSNAKKELENL
jgi:hypothetical protein